MKKLLYVVALALTTLFVACEPDFLQKDDESINPSDLEFATSSELKLSLKSYLCSRQLLAAGSDGSMTYLEGTRISELGHWLLLDNERYGSDTIFATIVPSVDVVVNWEVADPSVVEIVSQSEENNYIVVKAKKLGSTTIKASVEDKYEAIITTTVVDAYATKMLGYDGKKNESGYRVENYTIFLESEDPNSKRKEQKVWMKIDQTPAEDEMVDDGNGGKIPAPKAQILWSVSEEGIVDLDIRPDVDGRNDTCIIKPKAEGLVTVLATCQYRTVQVIVTVKNNQILTTIDSLQFTDNNGEVFDKLWLSRSETNFVNVACFPDNAYSDYTDGYQWISLNPSVAVVESTGQVETDEYQRVIRGVAAGETQIQVSLGIGEKRKTKTFDVKVCNAVTSISITAENGATSWQTIGVGDTRNFIAEIDDADAATEYGSLLEWYLKPADGWDSSNDISDYMTIDNSTGEITALEITPENQNCLVYAKITHPKYPGHPTDNTTVTVESNTIVCSVIAGNLVRFNPVSLEYVYSATSTYPISTATFTDAAGNTLSLTSNKQNKTDFLRTAGSVACSARLVFTYTGVDGSTYNFKNSADILTVTDNGDGSFTYEFNYTVEVNDKATLKGSGRLTPKVTEQ